MENLDVSYTQSRANVPDALDVALAEQEAINAAESTAPPPPPPPESFSDSFIETVKQVPLGFAEGVKQQARAVEGVLDGFDIPSVVQLTDKEGNFDLDLITRAEAGDESILFPDGEKPEGFVPNLARGVGQFVAGFIGPFKGLTRVGGGGGTSALAAGAIADAFAFDPEEPTASEFLQSTGLANPVTEFLATSPDDSEAEQRFKNAVEGAILGKVGQKLTGLVIDGFKALRTGRTIAQQTTELTEKVAKSEKADKALADIEKKVGTGNSEVVPVEAGKIGIDNVTEGQVSFEGVSVDPVPAKAVNINLQKLNTSDDIKNVIAKTAEAFKNDFEGATRGRITLEQTSALADELGLGVEELLSRQKGQAFNAETITASRKILTASANKVRELAKVAETLDASDIDKVAFLRAVSVHKAIQQQVSGLTAEAGRALGAFRINIGQDITLALENVPVRQMASDISIQDTLVGLNQVSRNLDRATKGDMLTEVRINGLLSGPTTHVVNLTSNAIVNLWAIPDRFLAASFGKISGAGEIGFGETTQMLFGLKEGYRDGLKLAWKALKTGEPTDPLTKLDIKRPKAISAENLDLTGIAGRAVDFLGETIRLPGRFLTAGDELFKAVNYRMEVNALAFRQARQEGLEGRGMGARIAEIINDPPPNIVEEATQFSRVQTFTNKLGNEGGTQLQQFANSSPVFKTILPFVRTPLNIVKMVGVKSPLAPFAKSVRDDIAAGGARRDLALAKMSTGSMLMMTAVGMAAEGRITGGGSANPNIKRLQRNTGWQPYSYVIGTGDDKSYFSFNRLDPVGMTLGMAADFSEISGNIGDADGVELVAALVTSVAKNTASKTYVRGVTDVLGALDQSSIDPERESGKTIRYLEGLAISYVPKSSLLRSVTRAIDPTLRDTDGMIQKLKSITPGYSKDLPARLNIWGEEIVLEGGMGPDIMSPIYVSHSKESPISQEMVDNKISIGMPSRTIGGVRLTAQEYHDFVKLTNAIGTKEILGQVIKTKEYNRLPTGPDSPRANVISSIIMGNRAKARKLIETGSDENFRELRQRIREAK